MERFRLQCELLSELSLLPLSLFPQVYSRLAYSEECK